MPAPPLFFAQMQTVPTSGAATTCVRPRTGIVTSVARGPLVP